MSRNWRGTRSILKKQRKTYWWREINFHYFSHPLSQKRPTTYYSIWWGAVLWGWFDLPMKDAMSAYLYYVAVSYSWWTVIPRVSLCPVLLFHHWAWPRARALQVEFGELVYGMYKACKNMGGSIGAWKEGGGTRERSAPPPEIGNNCCRNLVLFSKALFLATTFAEIIEKSFFLLTFLSKFSQQCVFRPNARKLNAWFLKNFAKYAKIYIFANI